MKVLQYSLMVLFIGLLAVTSLNGQRSEPSTTIKKAPGQNYYLKSNSDSVLVFVPEDSLPSGASIQTLSIDSTGRKFTISISGGNSVSFIDSLGAGSSQTLSFSGDTLYLTSGGNVYLGVLRTDTANFIRYPDTLTLIATRDWVTDQGYLTSEVDGSTTNEIQELSWNDGTDELSLINPSGNSVTITGFVGSAELADTAAAIRADFPTGGGPDQTLDTFQIISNTLYASLSSDGEAAKQVDLSPYLDNTDDYINSLSFNTGNGILTAGRLTAADITVDLDGRYLTSEVDGSTTNELQSLTYSGDTLYISDGNNVVISSTDDQTLTLSNDSLSITGGNTVTFASLIAPGVTDNGTTLTADFGDKFGGIIQVNLNDAGTATLNLNNLRQGVVYTCHVYNATNTDVTLASNESETDFNYIDGTVIASDLVTIAEGDMITFYFDGTDIWTTLQP